MAFVLRERKRGEEDARCTTCAPWAWEQPWACGCEGWGVRRRPRTGLSRPSRHPPTSAGPGRRCHCRHALLSALVCKLCQLPKGASGGSGALHRNLGGGGGREEVATSSGRVRVTRATGSYCTHGNHSRGNPTPCHGLCGRLSYRVAGKPLRTAHPRGPAHHLNLPPPPPPPPWRRGSLLRPGTL